MKKIIIFLLFVGLQAKGQSFDYGLGGAMIEKGDSINFFLYAPVANQIGNGDIFAMGEIIIYGKNNSFVASSGWDWLPLGDLIIENESNDLQMVITLPKSNDYKIFFNFVAKGYNQKMIEIKPTLFK